MSEESLSALVEEFEAARVAEDRRLASLECLRISPWNPRSTMRWGQDRAERRIENIRQWSVRWWAHRGYRVIWGASDNPRQVPSFEVELDATGQQDKSTGGKE